MFLQNPTSPLVTVAFLFQGSPETSFICPGTHYSQPAGARSLQPESTSDKSFTMQRKLIKCSVNSPSYLCILKGILGEETQKSERLVVKSQISCPLNGGGYFEQPYRFLYL